MEKNNHFVISYAGNKRKEVEKIYESIKSKLNNIEFIIEPYCGSSALSCYISQQHPGKFKYILNDNNEYLIELYNTCKSKKQTTKMLNSLVKLSKTIKNKEDYNKLKKNDTFLNWLYLSLIYSMRAGLYPLNKKTEIDENKIKKILDRYIFKFLQNENVTILNEDGLLLYTKNFNNPKVFIFLDPPYLFSCNQFYKSSETKIYDIMT
jgi:site-specific DNA-adenine methylase